MGKKKPILRNQDGDVFKHEKNPQREDPLFSKMSGFKNGPNDFCMVTVG